MRVHFVLNHNGTPESKLADVEIHFDDAKDGPLYGLKLVGCSVWRSRKGEEPTVLVPSRSYATAGGVRYYELLRGVEGTAEPTKEDKERIRAFKTYIKDQYKKITGETGTEEPAAKAQGKR